MPGAILRTSATLDQVPAFEEHTSDGRNRHTHIVFNRGIQGNTWISGSSTPHKDGGKVPEEVTNEY